MSQEVDRSSVLVAEKVMTDLVNTSQTVLPGAVIGMVGGGQLGRMFAIQAAAMGYRVAVFCGSADDPAAQVAWKVFRGELSDLAVAGEFASACDVISTDNWKRR